MADPPSTLAPSIPSPGSRRPATLTDPAGRIDALDILRGLAILGMIVVHFHQRMRLEVSGAEDLIGWGVWMLIEQKSWGTFAFLFGVGFALFLRGLESRGQPVVPIYLRRLAALAAFGVLAEVLFGFNILFEYACWGLVLLLVRRWPSRALLALALVAVCARPLATWWAGVPVPPPHRELTAAVAAAGSGASYLPLLAARWARFRANVPDTWPELLPDVNLALFILGLLAMRHGMVADPRAHRRPILAAMGYGALVWTAWWGVLRPLVDQAPAGRAQLLSGFGLLDDRWLCLTYIGAVLLLLAARPAWTRRLALFGQAGRMALTNYIAQVVIVDLLASGYGAGLRLRPLLYLPAGVLLFTLLALASRAWLARFRMGPLEWAWRCVTYARPQPLVRGMQSAAMLPVLVAPLLIQAPPAPPATHKVLIRDVTVVSPERKAPLEQGYVVLENDRIAAVGRGAPPAGHWDSVISGQGRVLIPGLIDGHTHLASPAGMPLPVPRELRSLADAYAEQLPRSYLLSGFTTVVDLIVFDRPFLDRFKAAPLHPDVYDCGPALALANGYPMAMIPGEVHWELFPNFLWDSRQKDSIPARFRPEDHTPNATVARVAAEGGICVKTFEERGYGPARNLPTPTLEMVREVVRESHARDLPVLMHANSLAAWRFAVQAGVDVIAHGMWNWDEFEQTREEVPAPIRALLDTVAARRIGFMPTLRVIEGLGDLYDPAFLDDPRLARVLPPALIAWYRTPAGQAFAAELRRNFGKASDERVREIFHHVADHGATVTRYLVSHGGRLVFGSDTPSGPTYGNPPGLNGFLELERLAAAGVPLRRLLEGATIEAARAFHLDSLYGTIEPGKLANLLLLRADPLKTVEAYDAIDLVVVRGRVLDRSALAAR